MKFRLTALALLLPAFCVASIQDDLNAARNGGTVILPATATIDAPLVIPAGARNLTLKGAPGGTTLRGSKHFDKQAIQVGVLPQLHNNWMITGANNIGCLGAVTGEDYVVTLKPVTPGYYILWDEYRIVCAKGPNVSMNHAELLKVVSYDPQTSRAKLGQRIGREYTGKVWLAPYDAATCRNITIEGISWDGKALDGSISEGMVAVGIADGVILRNLQATNFRSDAIMTNTARNVLIDRCSVEGASEGDAGGGYGFSIYRSRFVTVRDSRASGTRHSFILHSGAVDVTLQRCASANGFDTHGYDERRVALLDCTGDGGDFGNDAWLGGGSDFLVRGCKFTEPLGLHANVRNVRVVDSILGGVSIYSAEAGDTPKVGIPAGGFATGIRIDRTTIKGSITTQGAKRFGSLSMNGGSVEGWSTLIDIADQPVSGTYMFTGVLFSNGPDTTVQLRNQLADFTLALTGCTFKTSAGTCIWVAPSFAGNATFKGCVSPLGKTFLSDQSGRVVSQSNVRVN